MPFERRMAPGRSGGEAAGLLGATALFRGVESGVLRAVADASEWVSVPGGHTLLEEGEPGDSLFVVVAGRLRVLVSNARGRTTVGEIGPHETVGEMAVLASAPRSATVVAIRDSTLLRFPKDAFDRIFRRQPQAMMRIAELLVKRFQERVRPPARESWPRTVACAPCRDGASCGELSRALAAALAAYGPVLHLTGRDVAERLGRDAGGEALQLWLEDQEAAHRFVVYETDDAPSEWTQRCLRQADRIAFVAPASAPAPAELGPVERHHARDRSQARASLVLRHPPDAGRPQATGEWLRTRAVDDHYHVRGERKEDVERVARGLLGRGTAVALSGGGARGFAHIGVLRALDENGVAVDRVAGSSQGALMGALYALGHDHRSMTELAREAYVRYRMHRVWSLTLPVVSLFDGRRAVKAIERLVGDACIEDLWVAYVCVSTNLTRARRELHERGPLRGWLRASCSIPGLFPPVPHEGDLLVDGAVLDNLPVEAARSPAVGTVIAVDVTAREDLRADAAYERGISGWQALLGRVVPSRLTPRVPGMFQLLSRVSMLASVDRADAARATANLTLHPPVGGYGMLDWGAIEAIVESGYRYASVEVERWLRAGGADLES